MTGQYLVRGGSFCIATFALLIPYLLFSNASETQVSKSCTAARLDNMDEGTPNIYEPLPSHDSIGLIGLNESECHRNAAMPRSMSLSRGTCYDPSCSRGAALECSFRGDALSLIGADFDQIDGLCALTSEDEPQYEALNLLSVL